MAQSRRSSWPVQLSLTEEGRETVIRVGEGEGEAQAEATLWVMPIVERTRVKIEKGEMAGREIAYTNVVRKLVPAGMWTGRAMELALPRDGLMPPGASATVALLQQGKAGPILGCACRGSVTS